MVRVQPKVMGFIAGVLVISALLVLFNAIYSGGRGNSFTGVQVWHPPETSLNAEDEVGVVIKSVKPDKQGNLELILTLKLADIVKFMDKFSNSGGPSDLYKDPTSNAIVPNIDIIMNPKDLCPKLVSLKWMYYVHTSPGNSMRRENIRSTWGNPKIYADGTSAVVFIVGRPSDPKEQLILDSEQKKYGDIVQGDFLDTYRNLTLKTVLGLKWIATYCPNSQYYIKADDDAFINVFEWMKMAEVAHKQNNRFIMCSMWLDKSMPILRDPEKCMKWCVKYSEFPGRSHFPGYCAGLALMMSGEIIKEMYETAQKTRFFWIDDVFLTGIVSKKLPNIYYHTMISNFTLKAHLAYNQYMDTTKKITYQLSHIKDYKQFNEMWTSLLKRVSQNIP